MYEIPSDDTIEECVVTKAAVDGESEPLTIHEDSCLLYTSITDIHPGRSRDQLADLALGLVTK